MSFWRTIRAAWSATVQGSRGLTAARQVYDRGGSIPELVAAWARSTETTVDDDLADSLTRWLTIAAAWAQRVALVLVRIAIRLELQAPALVGRFVRLVDWLERKIPPVLAQLRAAADRVERDAAKLRAQAQHASVAASRLATTLGRLKGDG